jgi:hypothetical protein
MSSREHPPERERPVEKERNDLLRRVDWRFLLPQEHEPRTRARPDGGQAGDLARALALIADEAPANSHPDLVALVNPGGGALSAAAAALPPGGTLYAEWRRPQIGGRRRLSRRLEAAGLEAVRWHWPWPAPGRRPAFWLPLDSAAALGFFLAPRRGAPTRGRRLLAAAWPWALRLRMLAPLCATARKPGGSADVVETAVRLHSGGGDTVSWILLTGGRRSVNKVVGLPVVHPAVRPQLVVKFARSASEEEPLRNESEVLRLLAADRPELGGVPRALFLERRCGRVALGETALEGDPLIWRLDHASFDALCASVTDWLVALAGSGKRRPRHEWGTRLVDQPLERFARQYSSVASRAEIASARAALSLLDDLPLVCEQRDCAPWNVLLAGDRISVADWESAEPNGLPALDLAYFLTNAALHVAGALDEHPATPSYTDSLDPQTETGRTVARCEALYAERVGIDTRLFPALRLLCWTIHAHSEYQRFALDVAAEPPPELLSTGLFLELWRAELGRQAR